MTTTSTGHRHDHGASSRLAALEDGHFWFAGRNRLVHLLLDRYPVAPDGVLVDLGSGTGRFARGLAAEGRRVVAVDHSPGTDGPPGATLAADGERLPLSDASVSAVLARDVLEHLDDVSALAECARVLRPGGLLVVLVPGWPALWSDRDERAGHLRRYRRRDLHTLVESSGFTVLEQRGYQFLLLPAIIATRLASSRLGPRVVDREETPPGWLNRALTAVNTWEAGLARRRWVRPPTGSTHVVVARRREDR